MATALEVESATKALRAVWRPDDINCPYAGMQVGRYAYSTGNPWVNGSFAYLTTATAQAKVIHCTFAWAHTGGIAVIKKIDCTMVNGAKTATGGGLCAFYLYRSFGLGPALLPSSSTAVQNSFPPSQGGQVSGIASGNAGGGANTEGAGTTGLIARQLPAQARINVFSPLGPTGTAVNNQGYLDTQPIGFVQGSWGTAAGSVAIQGETLYNLNQAEQPLILIPGTGFQISCDVPAASTSQTVGIACNIRWDEWTPSAPGDR